MKLNYNCIFKNTLKPNNNVPYLLNTVVYFNLLIETVF